MRRIVIALLFLVLAPRAAEACFLDGVTPMSFGNYDPLSTSALETTATITLRCLLSLSVTIDISAGGSTTYVQRQMSKTMGAAATLDYQLYRDAARKEVWGNGVTAGTYHYGPVVAVIATVLITVYGQIPTKQNAPAGTYGDTVVVTLNY